MRTYLLAPSITVRLYRVSIFWQYDSLRIQNRVIRLHFPIFYENALVFLSVECLNASANKECPLKTGQCCRFGRRRWRSFLSTGSQRESVNVRLKKIVLGDKISGKWYRVHVLCIKVFRFYKMKDENGNVMVYPHHHFPLCVTHTCCTRDVHVFFSCDRTNKQE